MYDATREEKVAAGAMLCDMQDPWWYRKINRDLLQMQSCSLCIMGQLYGIFGEGLRILGITLGEPYGFSTNIYSSDALENRKAWKELKDLWIAQIDARIASEEAEEGVRTEELALV